MRSTSRIANRLVLKPKETLDAFECLMSAWIRGEKGFTGMIPPEVLHKPGNIAYGSRLHAMLLFFWAWLSRFGVKTNQVLLWTRLLISQNPGIIDPLDPCSDQIFGQLAIKGIMSFNPQGRISDWKKVMTVLKEKYQGDPRNIFYQFGNSKDELIERLRDDFDGVGLKIASLIIVWFQQVYWEERGKFWQNLRQNVKAVIPDQWLMRLVMKFGLVTAYHNDHHHSLARGLSDWGEQFCAQYHLSAATLSQSVFNLGQICSARPKSQSKAATYCEQKCPMNQFCIWEIRSRELKNKGKLGYDYPVQRIRIL